MSEHMTLCETFARVHCPSFVEVIQPSHWHMMASCGYQEHDGNL